MDALPDDRFAHRLFFGTPLSTTHAPPLIELTLHARRQNAGVYTMLKGSIKPPSDQVTPRRWQSWH
jgi:hypothetical protein